MRRRRRAVGFYTKGRGRGRKVIPITARSGYARRRSSRELASAPIATPPYKEAIIEVTAIGDPVWGEDQNIHFEDTLGGRWTVRPEGVNEVGDLNGHPILEVKREHVIRAPPSVETPQKHIESLEQEKPLILTRERWKSLRGEGFDVPESAIGRPYSISGPLG